jgi:hypothetical protein
VQRLLFILILSAASLQAAQPKALQSFLENQCLDCHDSEVKKAGLDLSEAKWDLGDRQSFELWVKVHDRVSKGEMPPRTKKTQPTAAERADFAAALHQPLHQASLAAQSSAGRTSGRRLNRVEYERTLHDLLHVSVPLVGMLPEDTPMHGFDTVAEGQRFSQLQMGTYLEAADLALDEALDLRTTLPVELKRHDYAEMKSIKENLALPDDPPADPKDNKAKYSRKRVVFRQLPDAVVFFTDADYMLGLSSFKIPRTGSYRVKISAYGYQSEGQPITLRLYANNYQTGKRFLGAWDMPEGKAREVEVTARIETNEHLMVLPFQVGYDSEGKRLQDSNTTKEFTGRGLAVQWVETEGPLECKSSPAPSLAALLEGVPVVKLEDKAVRDKWNTSKAIGYEAKPADPKAGLQSVVERFVSKALRRPLETDEAARFVALGHSAIDGGADFIAALKIALRAVLTSPQFLLFDEDAGAAFSQHALAARLSYALWSTLPDAELSQLAAQGKLTDPKVLRQQVRRLLADARSHAFVQHFTGQWLDLRAIDATTPDANLYPEFDEMLKRGMVGETEAFITELLRKDEPLQQLIHSDFVMLNHRMAQHYELGLEQAVGEAFVRVSLPADSPRGGVMTQASVLKITANGTVTSPVLRGAWMLKRLLGDPPNPPPPGTPGVEPDTRGASTIREILAKHRNSETCAGCHSKIDPSGFALEAFDVIGGLRDRYRSKEKGESPKAKVEGRGVWQYKLALPVDTTGELPTGERFNGIADFKQLLLKSPADVERCVAEKLVTYTTGAAPSYADRAAIQQILSRTRKAGNGLRTLLEEVVLSPLFMQK